MDTNDNPWWVAKEVCEILGIIARGIALQRLDDDEKGMCLTQTPGGPQQCRIVNEAGLYKLILRSRKLEAIEFRRWITHEVLPQIRKTGGYIMGAEDMSDVEILDRALQIRERLVDEGELHPSQQSGYGSGNQDRTMPRTLENTDYHARQWFGEAP